jgi:hypothetical protein
MVAAEMAVVFHVTDHGLDGGAAPQFAFDDAEYAAVWPEMKTRRGLSVVVGTVSLVDMGALDGPAGEPFGGGDDGAERVAFIRIAQQRLGVKHEPAARGASVRRTRKARWPCPCRFG